jgi:hypothetical protein
MRRHMSHALLVNNDTHSNITVFFESTLHLELAKNMLPFHTINPQIYCLAFHAARSIVFVGLIDNSVNRLSRI